MNGPWDKYKDRYRMRPDTFDAYVDVWNRVTQARTEFTGWVSFGQAANAEPAQQHDRVHAAERIMNLGGYEIGRPTSKGARQWVKRQSLPTA